MTDEPKLPAPDTTRETLANLAKGVNALNNRAAEQSVYNMEMKALFHVTTAMIEALLPTEPAEKTG